MERREFLEGLKEIFLRGVVIIITVGLPYGLVLLWRHGVRGGTLPAGGLKIQDILIILAFFSGVVISQWGHLYRVIDCLVRREKSSHFWNDFLHGVVLTSFIFVFSFLFVKGICSPVPKNAVASEKQSYKINPVTGKRDPKMIFGDKELPPVYEKEK